MLTLEFKVYSRSHDRVTVPVGEDIGFFRHEKRDEPWMARSKTSRRAQQTTTSRRMGRAATVISSLAIKVKSLNFMRGRSSSTSTDMTKRRTHASR